MSNHFIPNKPHAYITDVFDTKYKNGVLNPMEKRTIIRNICIDSTYRNNYHTTPTTDFTYYFQEPLNNVMSIKISSSEIPYVWYSFSEKAKTNYFTMNLYARLGDGTILQNSAIIKLPEGNYDSAKLIFSLNCYFANLANTEYNELFNYLYFDIEETSAKCIFRTKCYSEDSTYNNFTLYQNYAEFWFEVDFRIAEDINRPAYKSMGWMLGFKNLVYTVQKGDVPYMDYIRTNASRSDYDLFLCSESAYGNALFNYILFEIDDFQKNVPVTGYTFNRGTSVVSNNIIGRIQAITGFNTILTNNNNDGVFKKREYFGPVRLEKLHIRLLNKYGEVLELNGNDFSFVLEIEQLYSQ